MVDSDYHRYIDKNRKAWNKYTRIHLESQFYDLDSFLKGSSSIHSTEKEELGDIKNKSLLHLQCHFGLDTMSLERLGAKCTGVDISEESIKQAKIISEKLGMDSNFIQSDIYKLKENLNETYDLVFTSYGVLFWLPDLDLWAKLIYEQLKPGGSFYIIEFHPFLDTLDEDFRFFKYPYFNQGKAEEFVERGTYADKNADILSTTYGWSHSLSEVITALKENGLEISFFHEFPFCHYKIYPDMIQLKPGRFYHKQLKTAIPYMYSIMARKTE